MKRQIYSALKQKSVSPDKRLKSAVQFKLNDSYKSVKKDFSRIQSGATVNTYSTVQTGGSTFRNSDEDMPITRSQHTVFSQKTSDRAILIVRQQSQESISHEEQKKKISVTFDNMNSIEVQKRARFDKDVRAQVQTLRIMSLKDEFVRTFLVILTSRERSFLEGCKQKQQDKVLDDLQDFTEIAYGTQSSLILAKVLLFSGRVMEYMANHDLAVYFYNQTRILSNYAKGSLDMYKMNSLIGLANCSIYLELYEYAVLFLKKALQYAWLNNNLEIENQVYERLGISYYYLGNIEKSAFYHDRSQTFDYELESSPLRKLSCDTLRIFILKNYNRNLADNISAALLNRMQIPLSNELVNQCNSDLRKINEQIAQDFMGSLKRVTFTSYQGKQFSTLQINGKKLLKEILEQNEFDFQVYTPKHSFKSESKCFDHLKKKKIHPQDVFHDPKFKNNAFNVENLGVISRFDDQNPMEDINKYKLPLQKQISIRLKKKLVLDVDERMKFFISSGGGAKIQRKNKILVFIFQKFPQQITHKNIENEKRRRTYDEIKKMHYIDREYKELISQML
ncbi:hypothetical protein pb186bvf_008661 [Paramecium bursaria]